MLESLIQILFGKRRREPSVPKPKTFRPRLEYLEVREVLANLTFVGNGAGAGANWSVPANWSTGLTPTAGDTVYLDATLGVGANKNSTMDLGGVGAFHIAQLVFRNNYTQTLTLNANLVVDVLNMDSQGTIAGTGGLSISQRTTTPTLPTATLFAASF